MAMIHHDLETADEHHRQASQAFSAEQREVSGILNPPAKPLTRLQRIVGGTTFESILMVVIMTNAVFVGVQTELAGKSGDQESLLMFAIDAVFTLVFIVELALRVYAAGWSFFIGQSNWRWNWLDAFTVATSIFDTCFGLAIILGIGMARFQGMSQLRVLRMLRLVRLLRGLRLTRIIKSVRELRTLVNQMMSTAKSMMWAMILLVMIIYLFAVSFTQAVTMYRVELQGRSWDLGLDNEFRLHKYWSSLPRSMFTLFMAITGGVSWDEAVNPLSDVGGIWVAVFILYICFAQMTLLNVITAYFCENAIDGAAHDPDLVAEHVLATNQMFAEKVTEIFEEMDADSNGHITLHEFEEHLGDVSTQAYFDSLGIDASDMWTLFKLMDTDSGHQIDKQEFVAGCMRLRGGATTLDLAKLAYDHRYLVRQLGNFIARTDKALSHLIDPHKRVRTSNRDLSIGDATLSR